ncbi:hypothetical protein OKA04_00445 [Luteolibacter flavescens]|uniref:Uncharacterized protein n=1 Tax=Luteolibacter flavescens TaxID=1859460 RepID=A0ABT3FIS1_9BACT|nr:hypothetical protein [Luteolibacter flavescens]
MELYKFRPFNHLLTKAVKPPLFSFPFFMDDNVIIDSAYTDTVKKLYTVLFEAFIVAKTKPERNAALARFKNGLSVAREAREAAKAEL